MNNNHKNPNNNHKNPNNNHKNPNNNHKKLPDIKITPIILPKIDISNSIYTINSPSKKNDIIKQSSLDVSNNKKVSFIKQFDNNTTKYIDNFHYNKLSAIDIKINNLLNKIRMERKDRLHENTLLVDKNYKKFISNIDNKYLNKSLPNVPNTNVSLIVNKNTNTNNVDKNVGTDDNIVEKYTQNSIIEENINNIDNIFHETSLSISNIYNNISKEYLTKYNNPNFHGKYNENNEYIPFSHFSSTVHDKEPLFVEKKKINIQVEIKNVTDLLKLIDDYPIKSDVEYNINMNAIHNIKEPLTELNNMIGMNTLKNAIVDQIIYFIQELHISADSNGDFMHTCIYGPPGTGKTEVAKIMGKIYSKLGILTKNIFKKVTRADLIAGFLGQTSLKTKDVISECLGGVLFIDEAYALGNMEKRDSFAKECIDTICEALSDHKEDLMVIIAGYKEDLKKCFFAYNQGLDSRFTWRFNTDDYTSEELRKIFIKKVNDANWTIKKNNVQLKWFETNKDYFKFFGRDMETLFSKVKIAHSRRVFCLSNDKKKVITDSDLKRGFEMFLENDEVKNRNDTCKRMINFGMYS